MGVFILMQVRNKIRVVIADRDLFYLQKLKLCLERRGDMVVVGMADNGPAVFQMVQESAPDVLLMDVILGEKDGVWVLEQMKVKTFASNINELLAESFFLNGGFVGEFACQVVNDLTSFLLGKQHERRWDMDSADQLIETVGDDVVKIQLRRLFIRKFGKNNQAYKMWVQKEFERLGLNQENR